MINELNSKETFEFDFIKVSLVSHPRKVGYFFEKLLIGFEFVISFNSYHIRINLKHYTKELFLNQKLNTSIFYPA